MKSFFEEIIFSTSKKLEVVDLTGKVVSVVSKSKIRNGFVLVSALHATGALIVNEHEPNVCHDYLFKIKKLFSEPLYKHDAIDDNAFAHVASAIVGGCRVFPLREGGLVRGTWQSLMFLELDGPRSKRRVLVEVVGE